MSLVSEDSLVTRAGLKHENNGESMSDRKLGSPSFIRFSNPFVLVSTSFVCTVGHMATEVFDQNSL